MARKKAYRSKKWLNPTTTSFIFTEVEFDYSWGATLKIGDCNRMINLDVYVDDPKARNKTLKKLNLLSSEIDKLISRIEDINYG